MRSSVGIPTLLAHHKDPLASVNTVLNRLATYGEARIVMNERGKRAWEWATERAAEGVDSPKSNRAQAHHLLNHRKDKNKNRVSKDFPRPWTSCPWCWGSRTLFDHAFQRGSVPPAA